ncbi:MAG TPA: hypothetical protein VHF22_12035, partial [Planctomycetota bacterium]|nr:hypothetical protein [Planctomycetota bacterium]
KKIWLPEYTIDSVEQREMAVSYGTDFGNPVLAQTKPAHPTFVVTVFATRRFEPYLYKILLPLLCILGTAYLVFWLPPTDIKVACVLAIESLLSCFEFNVAIMEELPEVPYVMLTQKFFLWTFGILFTNLIQSVILYLLVKNGHDLAARRWSRTTRIVCPILFAACFGGLCLIARYR